MAPTVIYKCSKCGMVRDSYEDAEGCEVAHPSAVSVKDLEYRRGAYPFRVSLLFNDGARREYIADDGAYFNGGAIGNNGYNKDKDSPKKHKNTR